MERTWPQKYGSQPFASTPAIGRAHLDEAEAVGQIAGRDPDKTMIDCPYDGRSKPMTVKAWEKGFLNARAVNGERR
jgi:hypothetical protein